MDSSQVAGNAPRSFIDLPHEIRSLIFQHAFHGTEIPIVRRSEASHSDSSNNYKGKLLLGKKIHYILSLSHQTRAEAYLAFYQYSKFSFSCTIDQSWTCSDINTLFSRSLIPEDYSPHELIRHVSYQGRDIDFVRTPAGYFPNLKLLELDVGYDHFGVDHTHIGRAIRQIKRSGELRSTIKDYWEKQYRCGVKATRALFELQKLGRVERGFEVMIRWALGYRFLEFIGTCDLDEWILKIHDAEVDGGEIYEIPQDPLFCEMA